MRLIRYLSILLYEELLLLLPSKARPQKRTNIKQNVQTLVGRPVTRPFLFFVRRFALFDGVAEYAFQFRRLAKLLNKIFKA